MKINIIITILLVFISMNMYAQDNKLHIYYYPNFEAVDATLGYVDSRKVIIPAGIPYLFTDVFDKIAFVLFLRIRKAYMQLTEVKSPISSL